MDKTMVSSIEVCGGRLWSLLVCKRHSEPHYVLNQPRTFALEKFDSFGIESVPTQMTFNSVVAASGGERDFCELV